MLLSMPRPQCCDVQPAKTAYNPSAQRAGQGQARVEMPQWQRHLDGRARDQGQKERFVKVWKFWESWPSVLRAWVHESRTLQDMQQLVVLDDAGRKLYSWLDQFG